MNVKKSLENRIRGWLPKEPTLPNKASDKIDFQIDQQPLPVTNQLGADVLSATKNLGLQTIIWTLFSFLFIVQINAQNHIQLTSQTSWIIAGLTAGLIFSAIGAQIQLKHLAKEKRIRLTKTTLLFVVGTAVLLSGIVFGVLFSNLPVSIRFGFLTSVFASGPTFYVTRLVLFVRFESEKKMRIMQYWALRSGLFVVPKSSTGKHV